MNILFVTNMYPNSDNCSTGTFVKHQADQLRLLGHSVHILQIYGYRSKLNYIKAGIKVFQRTKNYKYDIVHAHFGLSGISALFRWNTPVVITLHGSDALVGIIKPMISRFVCKFSDGVIAVSDKISSVIPGHVIPCGVDLDTFKPYPQRKARSILGLPQDKKLILFPFNPQRKIKRYDLALSCIEFLKARYWNIELLIVYTSSNEKMPLYYSASDAMILCSDSEGSPTSVKEALACNIPVVSTDVGDIKKILCGIPGTAICKSTAVSLAEGLEQVLLYKDNNNFNGRCFMDRYSQQYVGKSLISFYERIIRNHNYHEISEKL